jgi:aminoglycoside phosphotransferase (APT) family kinase protein
MPWADVPERVRGAVERHLQSKIVSTVTHAGGFSPGFAGKIVTADGRALFAKAVSPVQNPDTPSLHRREARIVSLLPATSPVPKLLWTCDEGDGWILLLFEHVEGRHPSEPWLTQELNQVLEAMDGLAGALTPSPVTRDIAGTAGEVAARELRGWRWIRETAASGLDEWSEKHLAELVALEEQAPSAVDGDTLLHVDIRADNMLLTKDRVWFVDWPHACIGADWLDLVFFAPSVAMQGGPAPESLVERFPRCRGVDPSLITAAVAAMAGYFTHRSFQLPPPGLPTVRAFQAAQGNVARRVAVRTTRLGVVERLVGRLLAGRCVNLPERCHQQILPSPSCRFRSPGRKCFQTLGLGRHPGQKDSRATSQDQGA